MAAAKKCDICGALFEYDLTVRRNGIRWCKVDGNMNVHNQEVLELCPECMDAIHDVFAKRSKKV